MTGVAEDVAFGADFTFALASAKLDPSVVCGLELQTTQSTYEDRPLPCSDVPRIVLSLVSLLP